MRALAYLIGARTLDIARKADADRGRPQPELDPGPIATTPETAAAWRRWREAGQDAAASARPSERSTRRRLVRGMPG
jgi:hypothetical protein